MWIFEAKWEVVYLIYSVQRNTINCKVKYKQMWLLEIVLKSKMSLWPWLSVSHGSSTLRKCTVGLHFSNHSCACFTIDVHFLYIVMKWICLVARHVLYLIKLFCMTTTGKASLSK